ncbi:hypothetical protein DKX38_015997 [Salix brachista]|uniref:Uncharacterized protein n=1 Tax=Salix brachista TaxID=2182728 RepID=A0A5N5L6T7_9ROSI|nr:hypothetical protein DKX38_015997 [Salix brachista]
MPNASISLNKFCLHRLIWGGSGEALKELENEIHKINSLASMIHSVQCQVDFSKTLNGQAYDSKASNIKPCPFFFTIT